MTKMILTSQKMKTKKEKMRTKNKLMKKTSSQLSISISRDTEKIASPRGNGLKITTNTEDSKLKASILERVTLMMKVSL